MVSSIYGGIFAGTLAGMISIGYLGDTLGRSNTYLYTIYFAVVSTAVCTFATFGGKHSVELVLVICRIFIGYACGGFFPLSAAENFEEAGSDAAVEGISVMTLGQLLPYLLGAICALWKGIEHSPVKLDWSMHFILFMGIIPYLCALPFALRHSEAENLGRSPAPAQGAGLSTISDMANVILMPQYRWKLLACGVCWFLYDAVGFWIGLYSPTILEEVFYNDDFYNNMIQNVYANLTCVIAAGISIIVLKYRILNSSMFLVIGAFIMGSCFAWLGYAWSAGQSRELIFAIFLLCRFSTWIGVPHCTYLLPNEIFPREIRSTCNGLAAAMGKLGALCGIFVIPNIGLSTVGCFGVCAALCGLNMVVAAAVLIPTQVMREAAESGREETPLLSDPI